MLATVWVTSHLMQSGGVLPTDTPPLAPPLPPKKNNSAVSVSSEECFGVADRKYGKGRLNGHSDVGKDYLFTNDLGVRKMETLHHDGGNAVRQMVDLPEEPTSFTKLSHVEELSSKFSYAVYDPRHFSVNKEKFNGKFEQNSSCDARERKGEEEKQNSSSSCSHSLLSQSFTSQVKR